MRADGALGLGPMVSYGDTQMTPLVQTLLNQGNIQNLIFSLQILPSDKNSYLYLGGYNESYILSLFSA
jgi:hypothetical protein